MKPTSGTLGQAWRAGFVLLVGGWLIWVLLRTDFESTSTAHLWSQPQTWLFMTGWLALPAMLGALWWWQLRFSSAVRLPPTVALSIQGLAWGGRYLPGKAGLWLAKISIAGRHGADWRKLGHSVLVEQGLFMLAGMVIGLLAMPWDRILALVPWEHEAWLAFQATSESGSFLIWQLLASAVLLAGGAVVVRLSGRVLAVELRRGDWPLWVGLFLAHGLVHVIVGLALFPLVVLVMPDSAGLLGPWGVIAALALANTAGIAAVFAPAGLGVREVVLAGFLAVGASYPLALAVAAFLRLVTLVADVVFAGLAWLTGRLLSTSEKTI